MTWLLQPSGRITLCKLVVRDVSMAANFGLVTSGYSGQFRQEPRDLPQMVDKGLARRVLIVDDEPLIRWSLSETLADQGFVVEQASTAAAALARATEVDQAFDVVLLDFRLPDSSDLKLLTRLRQLLPATRIVLMTAFSTPEVVQSALDLGAFRVMNKPFEIGEIAALVR
jgi:CheY-like chemotaxis protein